MTPEQQYKKFIKTKDRIKGEIQKNKGQQEIYSKQLLEALGVDSIKKVKEAMKKLGMEADAARVEMEMLAKQLEEIKDEIEV